MSGKFRRVMWLCVLVLSAPGIVRAAGGAAFTVEDLVVLRRVGDPQISPDGRFVVFVERETDLEANEGRTGLWIIDASARDPQPRRLLPQMKASDLSPCWAPDSRTLYFLSTRSGSSQVWRLKLGGSLAQRVSDYPLDVIALKVSPRADRLALSMAVFPDCATLLCSKERLDARAKERSSGRSYERLFVRHWDSWSDGTRAHLFSAALDAEGNALATVDLSKPFDADIPSKPFGTDAEFAFSPDGKSLVFAARIAGRTEPWSTNFDLYQVPADGSGAPRNLTVGNPAWDTQPVFLANGELASLAQTRPGFESDRFQIVLRSLEGGAARALTASWDRSVVHLSATPDGKTLLASVDELGQRALYWLDPRDGVPHLLFSGGQVSDFSASRDFVVFTRANLGGPDDLYAIASRGGPVRRLTEVNRELLAARQLSEFEQFSFKGWNEETVYGYVMKPYGFEPGKRYPLAFIVHGGPQVSMQNLWTYRWNAQTFAGGGFAVVMIDFHGSPGYGQAFTDSVSRDWGGKPLVDLEKGLAAALARYPWLDGERACALGASYGGFMMNWIEGKWPGRFRCIVNHDGVFDQRMMYYTTDELWFPEWEFGRPEFENPAGYAAANPQEFVANWRTPMLVIHGEQDFRIPLSQGLGAFTALQRRGIESKLLVFPDENHWVLKPANSILWYHTVLGWLDAHLNK